MHTNFEEKLRSSPVLQTGIVPNYMKSVSWCRLKGAHNWIGGTIGGRENGMGRGRSVYKQPGTRVDEDHTTQRGGIPSK